MRKGRYYMEGAMEDKEEISVRIHEDCAGQIARTG